MIRRVDKLHRVSVTHTNGYPLLAAITLRATPRFPDEDSTNTESGPNRPSRSAASTISAAAFILTEPAKLKPSHFKYNDRPTIDSRSTKSSSSLKSTGPEITDTITPSFRG